MRPAPSSTLFPYTTLFRSATRPGEIVLLDVTDRKRRLVQHGLLLGGSAVLAIDSVFMKRSEEHTSELQSRLHLVCRLLLEKKNRALIPARPSDSAQAIVNH